MLPDRDSGLRQRTEMEWQQTFSTVTVEARKQNAFKNLKENDFQP